MALPSVAALSSSSKPASSDEGSNGDVRVKLEQPDEAEIRELAAKMVEANKQKMANMPASGGGRGGGGGAQTAGAGGQTTLLGYFGRNSTGGQGAGAVGKTGGAAVVTGGSKAGGGGDEEKKKPIDEPSQLGRFGWTTMGSTHIPYILRSPDEQYCAVRIVETMLLNKYMNYLHADIYSCTCIRSYYITDAEARLFNDVNFKHCESQFGREQFTTKDLVVRLQDAREFYNFLDVCYNKLVRCGNDSKDKCGFIRINGESVVPYTVRDGNKYVPLFYFEGETDNLKLKAEKLENWNLAYLKFCCKVQGIRNELFASETCSVISLGDIKSYFPTGTLFEDYWPNKVVESQLLVSQKGNGGAIGQWIKAPPGSTPPAVANAAAAATPVANATTPASATIIVNKTLPTSLLGASRTQMTAQPTAAMANGWPGLVGGQPSYPNSVRMGQAPISMQSMNQTASSRTVSYSRANVAQNSQPPQYYPSPHSMSQAAQMVSQPPPLVRVTGPPPTMGNSGSYTTAGGLNSSQAAQMQHLMSLTDSRGGMLPPPLHPQYNTHSTVAAAVTSSTNQHGVKYPPPLIPVNGTNAARYTNLYQPGAEVIDLSSPPQSPQTQQRVVSNKGPSERHENGMWKKLIPIMEAPQTPGSHLPFKIQKALVNEKMVPCINAKPYINTELLMTIPDLVTHFFPLVSEDKCRQVLQDVLKLNLYKGNSQQMHILRDHQKCKSPNEVLPLIQLRDVVTFMPQLRYMFERQHGGSGNEQLQAASKRQRTS